MLIHDWGTAISTNPLVQCGRFRKCTRYKWLWKQHNFIPSVVLQVSIKNLGRVIGVVTSQEMHNQCVSLIVDDMRLIKEI